MIPSCCELIIVSDADDLGVRGRGEQGRTANRVAKGWSIARGWFMIGQASRVPGGSLMTASRLLISTLAVLALLAGPLPGAAPPVPKYEYKRIHDPDGIGKFYMDREVAYVMGHLAANWLDRPEREKEEHSTKLLKALAL